MLNSAKLSLVFLAANAAFASAQVKVVERDLPSPLFADGSSYDVLDLPLEEPRNPKFGASQYHHHTYGASQMHHKPSTPGVWGPSATGSIPILTRPSAGTGGSSLPILTRPAPSGESSIPILTRPAPSGAAPTTKTWGASQGHHHPSHGPSQYHHHGPSPSPMWHGGSDKPWDKPEYHNPKPTGGDEYTPGAPGMGGNDPNAPPKDGDHPGAAASASARARLNKDTSSLYALYGNAAAEACNVNVQIPGAEITACPLEGGASGWDCLNLASTLESCGGCMSLGEGQDCTLIKGADSVKCVFGKCQVGSCEDGYWLDASTSECVAVA